MNTPTNLIIDLEFIKKVQSFSLAERTKQVAVMFVDGFVDEVDLESKTFYYDDGSEDNFENYDKSDFKFFEINELDIDLDDIFELVSFLKKTKKDIEKIDMLKKFNLLVRNDCEYIDRIEVLKDYHSLTYHQDAYFNLSAVEFKLIKD
jgi:hypothetical protein